MASCRIQHGVVDAVVTVHDRTAALRRNRFCQSRMQPLDVCIARVVFGSHQFPLAAPTPHLTFEIAGGFAEVAEADRLGIDRMQIRENLDQRVDAVVDRGLVTQRLELVGVPHDAALHVLDHLERRTQHRVVVAHRHSTGHRNRGVVQCGHHPVFARHVMRGRGQPVQWRAPQHPLRRVVVHQEGEVGPSARDELAAQLVRCGGCRPSADDGPGRRGQAHPAKWAV